MSRPGVRVVAFGDRQMVAFAPKEGGGWRGIRVTFGYGDRSADAAYEVVVRDSASVAWSTDRDVELMGRVMDRLRQRLEASRPSRESRMAAVEWTVSELRSL